MYPSRRILGLIIVLLSLTAIMGVASWSTALGEPKPAPAPASQPDAFRSSPVMFIENTGQWDDRARFQVWGGAGGGTMWLAEDAIWITVMEPAPEGQQPKGRGLTPDEMMERSPEETPRRGVNIKISFPGANPHPIIETFDPLDTTISYFYGNDPDKWRPDVPVWGGVRYVDLWPGVDLEITGVEGRWQWKLECGVGCVSALGTVKMRVDGAKNVEVKGSALQVETTIGRFVLPLLSVDGVWLNNFKRVDSKKVGASTYMIAAPFGRPQDGTTTEVIATIPGLAYSTYIGGSIYDRLGFRIAVDAHGNAFVTGNTMSRDFPTTPGAFDRSHNGKYPYTHNAFVAVLSADGSGLIYATFLGGSSGDSGLSIAVDSNGNVFVTGRAGSYDFPTTSGAFDRSNDGGDAFITKLSTDGSSLIYSTFLGGSREDWAVSIAVDMSGNAYVTGQTKFGDFPTTTGAFDRSYNGKRDIFVAKLRPDGSNLIYSTFLGGSDSDDGQGIIVDMNGYAYVVGRTQSDDFPITLGAFDRSYNGGFDDAFVAKLNADGSNLIYSTFLGGSDNDGGIDIAVDSSGHAYVTGGTDSDDFPTTTGAFDRSHNGYSDVFVTKLSTNGDSLLYSTFLGGIYNDRGTGISVDDNGHAYVTGDPSPDFPTTYDAFDRSSDGGDAFVTKLNSDGSDLIYSSFLGGSKLDRGGGIAVDASGHPYLAGNTLSTDFPTTTGAFDRSYNGGEDAFVTKLAMTRIEPTPTPVSNSPTGYLGRVTCDAISGWAGDRDDPNQPIDVHIYADGPWPNGTFIGAVTADQIRETAVCEALGGSNCGVCPADQPQCKHGFVFTNIPASLKDGQPHDIYVYGINLPGTSGSGSVLLGGVPKTLQCQSIPNQPTPTPPLPTPTATPDFPTCHLTIDKTAYPSTARIDGQVGVTLKLEGDCPSEIGSALDVALVIDRSASMCGDKLNQAQSAGQLFFDNMAFPPDQAAVVSFANTALVHTGLTGNRTQAQNALYNITCGGFSRIDAGLDKAYEEMSGSRRVAGHTPAIILLTDGNPEGSYADDVRTAAQRIKDAGIQLFTIGLGNDVNAALLREIATLPEYYYQSPTPEQLQAIYTRLASELRTVPAMNVDITDVIGPDFELVPDSFSGPATPTVHGDTLLWHLPRLESGVTELAFSIKPKSCGTFPTNQSASVSYDDNRGQRQTRTFPNPQVTIEGCNQDLPDVFVRDNDRDDGGIPSLKPWWVSPDIWVRHNNDGGAEHQNPLAGQRNYVYVRIWNRSNLPVRDIDVQMYYANPSLGLRYPNDWTAIGGPVRVNVVQAKDNAILVIPWDTPNIAGHFCLFVRITSSDDPIRDDRVRWENNIAQRNLHIIDYPQPPEGSCKFDENNLLTDRIAFDVVNTQAKSSMVDLQITVNNLGAGAQVRFEPGPLAGRWTSLDGLVEEPDGRLRVTRFPATIYGVRLNPHEQRTVHIEVKAPANSRFVVGLTELVRGKVVGGNSYQRVLPPCPIALPIILKPGPVTPTPTPCPPGNYTPPDVILVVDRSGSMGGGKIQAAKNAVGVFLDQMDFSQEQAGIVSFADFATLDQPLTQERAALDAALNRIAAGGGTAIGAGIRTAHTELISPHHDSGHVPAMVLLSDGQSGDDPIPAANAAKAAGIRIITIGLGSDADEATLKRIASSEDDYYYAPEPDDLAAIYQAIAGSIRCGP